MRVFGIGMATIDLVTLAKRYPVRNEKQEAEQFLVLPGGPTFTALTLLKRLGAETFYYGKVSLDSWGGILLDHMTRYGIGFDTRLVGSQALTSLASIWVDKGSGERTVLWKRGENVDLTLCELDLTLLRGSHLLYLDGHNMEAAISFAAEAKRLDVPVFYDGGSAKERQEELLPYVDVFIGSERFLEDVFPGKTTEAAILAFRERYGASRFTGFTLGERGAIGYDGKRFFHVEGRKGIDVVDTNGAGDIFHGAFAFCFLQGHGYERCLAFANELAGASCAFAGGGTAYIRERKHDAEVGPGLV